MSNPEASPLRWGVLFGVWLIYFAFGLMIASTAPLVGPITRDLGIGHGAMGAVLGAWQLIYIASALPLGAALDRIGVGLGLTLSAVIMAASGFLRAWSGDETMLFAAVAIFGLGGPMISVGAPKMIALWFTGAGRGMAMGIYMTGPALGGIVALVLTNAVLMPAMDDDWRAVLRLYAGFVLATGVVWWLLSRHPDIRARDGRGQLGKGASLAAFTEIVRIPTVQVVLAMSVAIFFFNHGLNNWLPEILRSRGLSPAAAGFWAAIPTVVGVCGSLIIPRFATSERRLVIMACLVGAAGAASVLLHLDPGIGLATGLVLQGIARSALMTVAILLLMEAPGVPPDRAGLAGGMFFTVAEIGGVLGPLSIGILSERTGGFTAPLYALGAVCCLLALLLVRLWRDQVRDRRARA